MTLQARQRPSLHSAGGRLARAGLTRLVVARCTTPAGQGRFPAARLHAGPLVLPCAFGAGGSRRAKREGDHASPIGTFRLVLGFYRPDRLHRWRSSLPLAPLRPTQGWCDDSSSPVYNMLVPIPCRWSHERLWRDDHLYDVVIVLDYNRRPRVKRHGSAIFLHCAREELHCAREGLAPTEGCIALRTDDLRRLLPRLGPHVVLTVR